MSLLLNPLLLATLAAIITVSSVQGKENQITFQVYTIHTCFLLPGISGEQVQEDMPKKDIPTTAPAPARGYIKTHFTPLSHYYLQLTTPTLVYDNSTPRTMAMSLLLNPLLLATLAAIITVSSNQGQRQTNDSF